ncbi:MAG: glycosyltransferase family 2 protein [Candidatus Margulisiibacteriota bacterium]
MPKISVTIVTFNSSGFIRACLNSLNDQSFNDFEAIIIDNASTDGTADIISIEYPQYKLIKNKENLGYCKAQNQGIKISEGKYILTLNPDIVLDKDFLSAMYQSAEAHPEAGSFAPKLLALKDGIKTAIIDSLGHSMGRNRHVNNMGSGKIDSGQFNSEKYVFGVSGAAAFYRKDMLESIKYEDEYLDEDLFMGYDDVDIDWRSKSKGWKTLYTPKATAWHTRSASMKKASKMWTFYNYRNRYLVILKNDFLLDYLRDLFPILIYETGILFSMIIHFQLIRVFVSVLANVPQTIKKKSCHNIL